jgi:hypothetical protein
MQKRSCSLLEPWARAWPGMAVLLPGPKPDLEQLHCLIIFKHCSEYCLYLHHPHARASSSTTGWNTGRQLELDEERTKATAWLCSLFVSATTRTTTGSVVALTTSGARSTVRSYCAIMTKPKPGQAWRSDGQDWYVGSGSVEACAREEDERELSLSEPRNRAKAMVGPGGKSRRREQYPVQPRPNSHSPRRFWAWRPAPLSAEDP